MRISTKGRYALRMMVDLAEHRDEGFVTLRDIAERQEISKKYLEQIVSLLNAASLLRANRGYQGGYALAMPPEEYTVGQILRITEGTLDPVPCLDTRQNLCPRAPHCKTLPLWQGLGTVIGRYLDQFTLQDVVDGRIGIELEM